MPRSARDVHLPIEPGATSAGIVDAVVDHIRAGRLDDGDWLPSTRTLAARLGRSRGVVLRAYDELAAAGFVTGGHGAGTRVSEGARRAAASGARTRSTASVGPHPAAGTDAGTYVGIDAGAATDPAAHRPPAEPPEIGHRDDRDLRPGTPDPQLLDSRAWTRAMRRAAARGLSGTNPWERPSEALRHALSEHLRRHRGLVTGTAETPSPLPFDSSRSAIAAVCATAGVGVFHTEDPGYRGAQLMAREHGLELRFHPADPEGLDPARLGDDPALAYVTPAHQYPLGYRMGVERRTALVDWARDTGSLVIEDDYDGEFRFGVAPLPALATLPGSGGHVVYVGTSSKSLSPDLRVAWCVPPRRLEEPLARWLALHRRGPSSLPAEALAAFLSDGAMDRHLARATRTYAHRRHVLRRELRRRCPGLEVVGIEAGLHLCVLTPGIDDDVLAARLAESGWRVRTLGAQTAEHALSGLVVNYSRLTGAVAAAFAADLGAALEVV